MKTLVKSILTAAVLSVSMVGFPGPVKAAEYAVILKTLANPFWQTMKEGLRPKPRSWGYK